MDTLIYRKIEKKELNRTLFQKFQRRQNVTKALRRDGDDWVAKDAAFIDDWSEEIGRAHV